MNTTSLAALLFVLSITGAAAESFWTGIPAVIVQFNGLVLLLSALTLATLGARTLLAGPRRETG